MFIERSLNIDKLPILKSGWIDIHSIIHTRDNGLFVNHDDVAYPRSQFFDRNAIIQKMPFGLMGYVEPQIKLIRSNYYTRDYVQAGWFDIAFIVRTDNDMWNKIVANGGLLECQL